MMRKDTVEPDLRVAVAGELEVLQRRLFLKNSLSLGGLALLSGCTISDVESVQSILRSISRWNDKVQGALFRLNALATIYPESMITKPFPFNAFYDEDEVPEVDAESYKLELAGLIRERKPWTLAELYALPQTSQVTRHVCVEGWSAIGKWGGIPYFSGASGRGHKRQVRGI